MIRPTQKKKSYTIILQYVSITKHHIMVMIETIIYILFDETRKIKILNVRIFFIYVCVRVSVCMCVLCWCRVWCCGSRTIHSVKPSVHYYIVN